MLKVAIFIIVIYIIIIFIVFLFLTYYSYLFVAIRHENNHVDFPFLIWWHSTQLRAHWALINESSQKSHLKAALRLVLCLQPLLPKGSICMHTVIDNSSHSVITKRLINQRQLLPDYKHSLLRSARKSLNSPLAGSIIYGKCWKGKLARARGREHRPAKNNFIIKSCRVWNLFRCFARGTPEVSARRKKYKRDELPAHFPSIIDTPLRRERNRIDVWRLYAVRRSPCVCIHVCMRMCMCVKGM